MDERDWNTYFDNNGDKKSNKILTAMVSAAVGTDIQIEEADPISKGKNVVYHLTVTDGEEKVQMVLKSTGKADDWELRREPNIMDYIRRNTDIPVPKVYGAVLDPNSEYPPFYIMEDVDGVCYDTTEFHKRIKQNDTFEILNIVSDIGRHLAHLHNCGPIDNCGDLGVVNDRFEIIGRPSAWDEMLNRTLDTSFLNEFGDFESKIRDFVESNLDIVPNFNPVPMHTDYNINNILIDPDTYKINALLDWENARSGHFEYDLVLTEQYLSGWGSPYSQLRDKIRNHLYKGYRDLRVLNINDEFRKRRSLYRILSRIGTLNNVTTLPDKKREGFLAYHKECCKTVIDTA